MADDWAVLSDMDGTLLDTESTWLRVVEAFIRERSDGLDSSTVARLVSELEGLDLERAARMLHARLPLSLSVDAVASDLDRRSLLAYSHGIAWRPGASELLRALSSAGVPLALVTSSPRHWVERFATAVDLTPFRVIVTADDTALTKPAPDPYLRAAAAVGLPPSGCVAIEDSLVGASAAVAAGCVTLVVGDVSRSLPTGARGIPSLVGVDADQLRSVARGSMSS